MDLWGFMSPFLLYPTLLALLLLILTFFFLLPGNDFAELHRQSDWFLCLHRPPQMLLIMSRCCCWRGTRGRAGFSCVLALSCAPGKKWSSDSYALKIVLLKNITLRPGIVKSKNLELVLQIHFLMKRNVKAPIVSGPSIRFPDSGINQWNVWERAAFPALISACSHVLCFIFEA